MKIKLMRSVRSMRHKYEEHIVAGASAAVALMIVRKFAINKP